ncbi:MAG TPA: tyrosine recombinase XerC [Ruminiclostridium sp.]|nr:tyrosine recombinase XerC [Ruminiclostridium sp.]
MYKRLYTNSCKTVRDFLIYMETIRGKSPRTVNEYAIDLRTFFRFIKQKRGLQNPGTDFENINVADIDADLIASVTLEDIYEYMIFIQSERHNNASTRARKVSSLRTFYKYTCDKAGIVKENPTNNLETPKKKKSLPKYLSLEESIEVLEGIDGEYKERNYCILTLFLNCALRLSELVGINFGDIHKDYIKVTGKGNKERNIYLNNACLDAIQKYKQVRKYDGVKDRDAFFISRLGKRISPKTVQWVVKKFLAQAGLDGKGYSVHKLRHTAATLMYQQGGVDIRVLKEILGHESLSTTEIYTHLSSTQAKKAVESSPLANIKRKSKDDNDTNKK